jgi:hypothetical protein
MNDMKNRPPISYLPTAIFCLALCGCQVLTYQSPNGERFSRTSFAATTSINSLTVESSTNGIRKVSVHGYKNDEVQALGTIIEAAVKAAIQSAK